MPVGDNPTTNLFRPGHGTGMLHAGRKGVAVCRLSCCVAVAVAGVGGPAGAQDCSVNTVSVPGDFGTIAAALAAFPVSSVDIVVSPGSHEDFGVNPVGAVSICIRSTGGPEVTTILGSGLGNNGGEGSRLRIEGFTFTGGGGPLTGFSVGRGGGTPTVVEISNCIFADNVTNGLYIENTVTTVTDCTFVGNGGFLTTGGGVFVDSQSTPTFIDCSFTGNSADRGGGMYLLGGVDTLLNCTFTDNTANFGGAIYANDLADPNLTNCLFVGNNAALVGGAMYNAPGVNMPVLTNCTLVENSAVIAGGAIFNDDFSLPTIINSILWGNTPNQIHDELSLTTARFSNIQGGWPGFDNTDADPQFVDPVIGDYHLQSGSPSIDKGNNWGVVRITETDLDGNPRFADDPATGNGGCGVPVVVDMGAYELQGNPGTVTLGDLNGDCAVNVPDLLTMLAAWGPTGGSGCWIADLDLDDIVGVPDLLLLLAAWGPCP